MDITDTIHSMLSATAASAVAPADVCARLASDGDTGATTGGVPTGTRLSDVIDAAEASDDFTVSDYVIRKAVSA